MLLRPHPHIAERLRAIQDRDETCVSCPLKNACPYAVAGKHRCNVGRVFGGRHMMSFIMLTLIMTALLMLLF